MTAWKDTIKNLDGFILVTTEYKRVILGALANAFHYLVSKLNNKKLAFVGYGFLGLARAITNFRATLNYQNVLVI
ncbi:NADPH-dependent FMN reductase [Haploplasma modicum]|uniref:NADPH-dependent FMN reductase n=1 Tax=Haploplasma modicum TaxID=2150 RepID=UPI000A078194|nr:NAD(P)H-dependent oxidoreductase [Haploplasma modicum]